MPLSAYLICSGCFSKFRCLREDVDKHTILFTKGRFNTRYNFCGNEVCRKGIIRTYKERNVERCTTIRSYRSR